MSVATKTAVPQLCDLNLSNTTELLKKYSNYLDIFSEFVDQIETSLSYRNTFYKNDTVNERINFFNSLTNKIEEFDIDFVLYWFEQANTMPEYIKSKINVSSFNLKSDSIGKFTNSQYIIDDSTSNVMDFMMTGQRSPDYRPYNSINKLSPYTSQLLERASYRVNSMYRANISIVQVQNYRSIDPHGRNLVSDSYHYSRTVNEYKEHFYRLLENKFRDEIKIIAYFCNVNDNSGYNAQDTDNSNLQKIVEFDNLEIDIEQIKTKIDLLSNKVVFLKQLVLNDEVLSTEKIETVNQKQLTTEEYNKLFTSGNFLQKLTDISIRTTNRNIATSQNEKLLTTSEFKNEINYTATEAEKSNSEVANELEVSAKLEPSAQFYPSNVWNPTYQAPEWARNIYNCLGIGAVADVLNQIDITDPLGSVDNLLNTQFNLFDIVNQFSPFDTSFLEGFGIDLRQFANFDLRFFQNFNLDQQLDSLLNTIQNFDISNIFSAFSFNFPIPSFTIGTIFDFANNFDDIIKTLSDRVLKEVGKAITSFLENVACGGNSSGYSFGSLTFSG